MSVGNIDDSYVQAPDFIPCVNNVIDTLTLFNNLGFVVHPEKSVLYPTQKLVFLAFVFDLVTMRISLAPEKTNNVRTACQQLLMSPYPFIREVARVIGIITSSFLGGMFGPLHYKWVEINKTRHLRNNKGAFDKPIKLFPEAIKELTWWIDTADQAYNPVSKGG